jgi:hypothetical protein
MKRRLFIRQKEFQNSVKFFLLKTQIAYLCHPKF